jgi:hypothetical protein
MIASTDCSHGALSRAPGKISAKNWIAGNPAFASELSRKLKIRYVTKRGPMVRIPARILPCRLRNVRAKTGLKRLSFTSSASALAKRILEPAPARNPL